MKRMIRRTKRLLPLACLLLACLLLPGCRHPVDGDWREYKIFCGMSRDGGTVSETEWQQFCDECVSAEFPDGYTTVSATGCWRSGDGDASAAMREDSRIIVILAPSEAKEKVRRIAARYRRLFHQEAVLVSTSPADAEFVERFFDFKE